MTAEEIHRYWFDDTLAAPSQASARMSFWFRPARETDQHITLVFGPVLRDAAQGALDAWQLGARSCLSLVIVLDQFPRNIYRGTPAAFELMRLRSVSPGAGLRQVICASFQHSSRLSS